MRVGAWLARRDHPAIISFISAEPTLNAMAKSATKKKAPAGGGKKKTAADGKTSKAAGAGSTSGTKKKREPKKVSKQALDNGT